MSNNTDKKMIAVDQLQTGLFISLEEHWLEHPFLLNSFKIKNEKQIAIIKALGIPEIIYFPEKSDRQPLPPLPKTKGVPSEETVTAPLADSSFIMKQERIDRLEGLKKRIARTAEKFSKTVEQVPNLMSSIMGGSQQGAEDAENIVAEMVNAFIESSDTIMHLMSVDDNDQEMMHHFLNVSVLSLMVGSALELPADQLQQLGMGALLHDLGKMRIEKKHWRKPLEMLNKHEFELLRLHPRYGQELALKAGIMDKRVLFIIGQHHERIDGFGYPGGLRGGEIDLLAKITTIANIFDTLCNYYDPQKRLPPHLALQLMFKKYDTIIDMNLFSLFVKRVGVYPPGTIVQLSNDELGKIMSVDPNHPLQPMVMPYVKGTRPQDALLLDISQEDDISIKKALDPKNLPDAVVKYLKPHMRITYFMEQMKDEA